MSGAQTSVLQGAHRILLYGVTGSGKSTLARRLSEVTGIEWTDVDAQTWRPGWDSVPEDEQRAYFEDLVAKDAWVLDTAYSSWRDLVLEQTEVIVALDYPRWVSLGRLTARTVRRVLTRERVCNGNVETWGKVLSRDSILVWHFRSFARKRQWIADRAAAGHPPLVRLGHPRDAEALLARLRSEARPPP